MKAPGRHDAFMTVYRRRIFVEWVESAQRLVDVEPDEVIDDDAVRRSLQRLSRLIAKRVDP